MKVFILLCHPDLNSFNGAIANVCEQKMIKDGHDVIRQNLGELKFDPILWKGYKMRQELEPDLLAAQKNILWCDRWIIIYPIWWGSIPALFKGFLDRTLHSGFAYKYHEKGPFWDKLLKGRNAKIITTCDAPKWWIWFQYHNSDINMIKHAVLGFCGFKPVKYLRIDRLRFLNSIELTSQLKRVENWI